MKKNGRNHFDLEDARRLTDLASKTIGIPDPHGVYAFRIGTNVRRLKAEITALKTVEKEIPARSNGDDHIRHLTEMCETFHFLLFPSMSIWPNSPKSTCDCFPGSVS